MATQIDTNSAIFTIQVSWQLMVVIVGLIAWFVRLEAKVHYNEKQQLKDKESSDKMNKLALDKIEDIDEKQNKALQLLSEIQGRLNANVKKE